MSELRRGVLAFDIAGSIPPGSMITAVSLSINMSRSPTDTAYVVELHKLLADWGEGTSHRTMGKKVTERRLRRMMPHGDTVSSTRSFGQRKAEIFRPR